MHSVFCSHETVLNVLQSNILVTEAGHALLVDTGINATVVDTCEYIPLPENASWLAPELFVWEEEGGSSNACTAMSDTYSFGRTIEEVLLSSFLDNVDSPTELSMTGLPSQASLFPHSCQEPDAIHRQASVPHFGTSGPTFWNAACDVGLNEGLFSDGSEQSPEFSGCAPATFTDALKWDLGSFLRTSYFRT